MIKFPIIKETVYIEALDKNIELNELTVEFTLKCAEKPEFDTSVNVLLDAGMAQDDINKLGVSVLDSLAKTVLDITYPNAREKLEELIKSGEYTEPTAEEKSDLKKN